MTKKVIVAGHICLDITPLFPEQKVENIADFLLPGRSIETKNVDVHTGGAVANTGLAMKILGADVSLMGKVGDDPFGEMVLSILKKYDADQGMIVAQGERQRRVRLSWQFRGLTGCSCTILARIIHSSRKIFQRRT